MSPEILAYIKTQRTAVLAVEMPDGSPHAATVHFAHASTKLGANQEIPLTFFFETHRQYRKAEALFGRPISRASLVIGTVEEATNMKTLQLDGTVRLIKPEEQGTYDEVYLGKFPEKREKMQDPKMISFLFLPTWWRFTDWHTPEGKKIWTSDKV